MSQEYENLNTENENQGDTAQNAVPPMGFTQFFNSEDYEEYQNYKETKKVKRVSNAAGVSSSMLFLSQVLLIIFSVIGTLVYAFAGETLKDPTKFLADPAIDQVIQIVFSLLSFTVPFIVVYRLFGNRISDLISFKKSPKGTVIPLFCIGLGMCAFANIGASYIDSIFQGFGIDYSGGDIALPEGVFGFILTAIATAAVPALVEEFAMRGLILGSLRRFGDGFALVTSSIVFGLMHGNFSQIPFAFMVGIFLGFAVIKTGSLRVSIIIHFINNFVSVVFSYLSDHISDELLNSSFTIYLIICMALAIFGIIMARKDETFFKIEDGHNTKIKRYNAFFTSPAVIIFIILSFLQAILYIFI